MLPDTRGRTLQRLTTEWDALWKRLNGLPNDELVLAELRWNEATATAIRQRLEGHPDESDYANYEAWTDRSWCEDRELSPNLARARAALSYVELHALLMSLPCDRWNDDIVRSWAIRAGEHYREHRDTLRGSNNASSVHCVLMRGRSARSRARPP